MNSWLRMIRPVNVIMSGLGVAIGFFLASKEFPIEKNLVLAMLSAMLIAGAGMVINDYFDRFIDARIKPEKPIPSGKIKAWHALLVSLAIFGIGIWVAKMINPVCLWIAFIASALLILYSWFLSRVPLVGNSIVAFNTGLLFIFGEAAATGKIFSPNVSVLFFLAFLSTLAREIYKDIEDVEGDKISRKTLPMIIGEEWSKLVAGSLVILSVIASPVPYLLGTLGLWYLLVVGLADLIFLYISFASLIKPRVYTKELKIAQLVALLAFLVGM